MKRLLLAILLLCPLAANAAITAPVSFWNLDESSGNITDGLGTNTLTNNNTVTFVAGLVDNAADLELSSSQSFSKADPASLDFSGDFSFACFINNEALTAGAETLIAKTNGSSDRAYNISTEVAGGGSVIKAFVSGDGTTSNRKQTTTSSAVITAGDIGTWVHVAATFDIDAGVWVIYRNGSSVSVSTNNAGTVSSIYNSASAFQVGASNFLGSAEQFFDGKMDMCGVWNVTLTGAEVTELYAAGAGNPYPFAAAGGGATPPQIIFFD